MAVGQIIQVDTTATVDSANTPYVFYTFPTGTFYIYSIYIVNSYATDSATLFSLNYGTSIYAINDTTAPPTDQSILSPTVRLFANGGTTLSLAYGGVGNSTVNIHMTLIQIA